MNLNLCANMQKSLTMTKRMKTMTDFCDGELGKIERMMKEVPNFDKRYVHKAERDCPYCRHWLKNRCSLDKCSYFD